MELIIYFNKNKLKMIQGAQPVYLAQQPVQVLPVQNLGWFSNAFHGAEHGLASAGHAFAHGASVAGHDAESAGNWAYKNRAAIAGFGKQVANGVQQAAPVAD